MANYELTALKYDSGALEPIIGRETIEIHHGKHLQTYVTNLNNLIRDTPWERQTLQEIVIQSEGGIRNNAGQILNHEMYFEQFTTPQTGCTPTKKISDTITRDYGSFDTFKNEFVQKGSTLFGSGWVWLSADNDGKLIITQEQNADNPLQKGLTPLLTFDVWEHAYYLDYQNRRPEYLSALWNIIDWTIIEKRLLGITI